MLISLVEKMVFVLWNVEVTSWISSRVWKIVTWMAGCREGHAGEEEGEEECKAWGVRKTVSSRSC